MPASLKQVEENQERSISNIAGNIQDVITWLEAMKKDGWETIRLNWDKDLVFTLMREKYYRQIGENTKRAERIRELEEQRKVLGFLVDEGTKELETEQAAKRELYAMLSHIVDWSPELPYYMKDEYKTLFKNALAAARELLSKCSVKEGK